MNVEQDLLSWVGTALGTTAGPVTPETSLIASGRLHSLQILELIEFAEGRFQVRLEELDLNPDNFETVSAMVNLVQRRQRGQQ